MLNILMISVSIVLKNNVLKAKQKNVCFRLPTVPKFRSPTPIFTIDSSRRKMFSVSSLFLLQLIIKNNFAKSVL